VHGGLRWDARGGLGQRRSSEDLTQASEGEPDINFESIVSAKKMTGHRRMGAGNREGGHLVEVGPWGAMLIR
jgi:hypothetical protein